MHDEAYSELGVAGGGCPLGEGCLHVAGLGDEEVPDRRVRDRAPTFWGLGGGLVGYGGCERGHAAAGGGSGLVGGRHPSGAWGSHLAGRVDEEMSDRGERGRVSLEAGRVAESDGGCDGCVKTCTNPRHARPSTSGIIRGRKTSIWLHIISTTPSLVRRRS